MKNSVKWLCQMTVCNRFVVLLACVVWCIAAQGGELSGQALSPDPVSVVFSAPYGADMRDPVGGPQQENIRPQSALDIIIPEGSNGPERRAAYELSQWLEQMTGALFPVLPDCMDSSRLGIHLGMTQRAKALALDTSALSNDGYLISVDGDDIFLTAATGKGLMNAVYSMLEEDLGCRWMSEDATYIPWRPTLVASIRPRSFSPPILGREPFFWSARWANWALRNKVNASIVKIPADAGGYPNWAQRSHNFFTLVPPEKYLESHPDYFGITKEQVPSFKKRGGSLNLAHPDVLEILIGSVRDILHENPDARYMMIAQEDDAKPCKDPLSQAYYDTVEENPSSLLIHFINQVAERLEPEFPEVLFVTYAYQSTINPPSKVRPRQNVGIRLANMGFSSGGLLPVTSSRFAEVLSAWEKLTDKIFIYDYWANYLRLPAPQPNLHMIADNIRFFAEQGVSEISGLGSGWRAKGLADRDEMKSWIIAHLLWNPATDVDVLREDFCRHYYGAASDKILEFEQLLETYRMRYQQAHLVGKKVWLLDDTFNKQATERIEEALALADTPEAKERVAKIRTSMAYQWLLAGPSRAGGRRYAHELETHGPTLLDALETTRFATPWHKGESPPNWRFYWKEKLDEYNRQEGSAGAEAVTQKPALNYTNGVGRKLETYEAK